MGTEQKVEITATSPSRYYLLWIPKVAPDRRRLQRGDRRHQLST